MQYLLTQAELDELKSTPEMERRVDEWKIRIIQAMTTVMEQHHVNYPSHPLGQLIIDLKTAMKTA